MLHSLGWSHKSLWSDPGFYKYLDVKAQKGITRVIIFWKTKKNFNNHFSVPYSRRYNLLLNSESKYKKKFWEIENNST